MKKWRIVTLTNGSVVKVNGNTVNGKTAKYLNGLL